MVRFTRGGIHVRQWFARSLTGTSAIIVLCFWGGVAGADTTAKNGTSRFWTKPTNRNSSTWLVFAPTGTETIDFSSGPNETDGVTVGPFPYPTELKFSSPPLAGRIFTGFSRTDGPGPKGSVANTSGGGSSTSFTYAVLLPNPTGTPLFIPVTSTGWRANYAVSAGGSLGAAAGASYDAIATVADPDYIDSGELTGDSNGQADVYVPFEITSGSFSPGGSITMHADIRTAGGTFNLLDVNVSGATGLATVTPEASNVSYYLQTSLEDGPPTSGTALSASSLQTLINSDLAGGQFVTPLDIGIVLNGMTVPTQLLSNPDDPNALAAIDIGATAQDAASLAPEPASAALLCVGGLGLLARRRRT